MSIPISAKFFNQIYRPTCHLLQRLAQCPFAIEPESNGLLHQFEGIVLHTNHFGEKNKLPNLLKDKQFHDLANSIKHICSNPDTQVDIESALIFEITADGFRFVRNTILAKYINKNEEFDAIEKLCNIIGNYFPIVGLNINSINIIESGYLSYPWAIAYQEDELAAVTQSTRLITVKKEGNGYIKFDPTEIKFVVLEKNLIGKDPTPYILNELKV